MIGDICTSAETQEVIEIFESLGYKVIETGIKHGTVTTLINSVRYEITTFRIDGKYDDNRHPKQVQFTNNLKEDLSRRDFTINAMAYNNRMGLIDYFEGLEDLRNKVIRCVGNPCNRMSEDALRMMRAIRFSSQLGFEIEDNTFDAIIDLAENLENISKERIRDELCKILICQKPLIGLYYLINTRLMDYVIPEIYDCIDFKQYNKHHDKDVFNHISSVIENTPQDLTLRLSALLHDIGKPQCFTLGEDGQGHFYSHQKISADMSREILTRLRFDNKTIDKVSKLIYNHMTPTNINNKSIKKLINRVGEDNIYDLIKLMIADKKGCAKKYQNYDDILELKSKIDYILNEKQPLSIKDLNINGYDLMKLGYKDKEIGIKLNELLEMVLKNFKLNTKEQLIKLAK